MAAPGAGGVDHPPGTRVTVGGRTVVSPTRCWCGMDAVVFRRTGDGKKFYACAGWVRREQWCTMSMGFLGWCREPESWNQAVWQMSPLADRQRCF